VPLAKEIDMADTTTNVPVKTKGTAPKAPAPWAPFESLRRQIDSLFDDVGTWRSPFRQPLLDIDLSLPWAGAGMLAPATDVTAKDGQYEITAELPGLDEKNIEVKVAEGTLTITGEKKEESEKKEKDYVLSERRYGSFYRSFALPDDVDASKIAATFAKGVLTVTMPKSAAARANEKKIEVKAA